MRTCKRALTEAESVARYSADRHQTGGERIYRVRFGNANGFMASYRAFIIGLTHVLGWRQLEHGKGMAIALLSGIVGRLDLLPTSQ